MTPFDKLFEILVTSWQVDLIILAKGGLLLFLFLYILFSLVVVRQVQLMDKTVKGLLEKWLEWAAKSLVALAIIAFILAVIVL